MRVVELHRGWWNALATADAESLRAQSASGLIATLSSGSKYTLETLLRSMGTTRRTPKIECAEEAVLHLDANTALVTSECSESSGTYSTLYRFLSFQKKTAEGWKVAAVQSTWRSDLTKRADDPGPLVDFAGSYRTPRGRTLDVRAENGFLVMREPSGLELRLDPIGPGLFEADYVAPGGWVTRYSFARDGSGRVVSLNVLSPGAVNTFPRN
jgi:ketosteroid isomerase-like protein